MVSANQPAPAGALDGVRVLDLSQYVAGPFCARLLGDYGADVLKVEKRGRGDVSRAAGPFRTGDAHPDRSGLFLYLNTNKRGLTLDLASQAGKEKLLDLLDDADVFIESFRPGTLERWGLGPDVLLQRHPRLVLTRISNFGQSGPYRDWKASEIVLYAMGGELFSTGAPEREPIKLFDTATQIESGAAAAAATMGALLHAEATGQGQTIDCSLLETQLAGIDRRSASLLAFAYSGRVNSRAGGAGLVPGIWPCEDGYIDMVTGGGATGWPRLLKMLGEPEALLDPAYLAPVALADPLLRERFVEKMLAWTVQRPKRQAWQQAQAARVLSGPLNTVADLFADPELRHRGAFVEVDHPSAGRLVQTGRPFVMDRTPARPPGPAPLLDDEGSNHWVAGGSERSAPGRPPVSVREGASRATSDRPPASGAPGYALPLAGVRIVDFTVVWAGPFATHILADLGAEVIRVENINAWQTLTRGVMARPPQVMLDGLQPFMGGYPDGVPGERPWNRYPTFNCHARNKLSVALDPRTTAGRRNFEQLIATCDAVLDNNVGETMIKLGVTYESLRAMRDDIIYLRQPALADDGPYAKYRALGIHLEGFIGHTLLRRYPDRDASMTSPVFVADYMAGALGAFAVMLALRHRRRTGEGQRIELGQAENALPILAQATMEYALSGTLQEPLGNRHPTAIQGVYPCLPEPENPGGPERLLALTIATDAEWQAFSAVVGTEDWRSWTAQPGLQSATERHVRHDEIDDRIAAWTRGQVAAEAMQRLQATGVAAGVVMNAADCFGDPHLAARNFFIETSQEDVGTHLLPGFMWQFGGTPLRVRRGPVRLGEDNRYIYAYLLGLTDAAIEDLRAQGEIGEAFAAFVP